MTGATHETGSSKDAAALKQGRRDEGLARAVSIRGKGSLGGGCGVCWGGR